MPMAFEISIRETRDGWAAEWEIAGSQSLRRAMSARQLFKTEAEALVWLNDQAVEHGAIQVRPKDLETKILWDKHSRRRAEGAP